MTTREFVIWAMKRDSFTSKDVASEFDLSLWDACRRIKRLRMNGKVRFAVKRGRQRDELGRFAEGAAYRLTESGMNYAKYVAAQRGDKKK